MIKYTNSLLISIFVHVIFLSILFILYKNYFDAKKTEEEMLCVKLCSVEQSKEIEEKREPKEQKEAPKDKPKEQKSQKRVETDKEIAEKKIGIADEVIDVKPSFIEQTKDVRADAEPLEHGEKEKPAVEKETLQSPLNKEEADETPLKQKAPHEEYLEINMQKIAQLLEENLYYPMSARKRNITGLVKVSFTLGTDAKVDNIRVVESQSEILSRAAVKTIRDLSAKFPKPTKELTLSVPINYNLN